MPKKELKKIQRMSRGIGPWAFFIGVLLALVLGLFSAFDPAAQDRLTVVWVWVLVIFGVIIGLLNIAEYEVEPFLLAGTALVIVSTLGMGILAIASPLDNILQAILALFVPSTIIVAVKRVMELAQN